MRPHAGRHVPPGRGAAPRAERLARAAAEAPAALTGRNLLERAHPRVQARDRLVANVPDRTVDLLDAGRDVAEVVDVEALCPRVALRHRPAREVRVDLRQVVPE